ncbi:MAG: hypothetical protein KDH96_12755 [Candidatus Riesia sp.]|nr:hypothetical protein [Candidatus Riesia sp.]
MIEIGNLVFDPVVIAAIATVVSLLKTWITKDYQVLISSMLVGILFVLPNASNLVDIVYGILYGLLASVGWSGVKGVGNTIMNSVKPVNK